MNRIRDWISSVGGYLKYCYDESSTTIAVPRSAKKHSRNSPINKALKTYDVGESKLLTEESSKQQVKDNRSSESNEERESAKESHLINEPSYYKTSQDKANNPKSIINKPSNSSRVMNFDHEELKRAVTKPIFPTKTILNHPESKTQRQKTSYQVNQLASTRPLVKDNLLGRPSAMPSVQVKSIVPVSKKEDGKEVPKLLNCESSMYNNNIQSVISHRIESKAENSVMLNNGKPMNVMQRAFTQRMASNMIARPIASRVILKSTEEEQAVPHSVRPLATNSKQKKKSKFSGD